MCKIIIAYMWRNSMKISLSCVFQELELIALDEKEEGAKMMPASAQAKPLFKVRGEQISG